MKQSFLLVVCCALVLSACETNRPGKNGVDGKSGAPGAVGPGGAPGKDAAPCSVTQQPQGSLITCPDGTSALVLNGTNGKAGADGTVVQPIQFCAGFTQTYPSVFAESGFCIDHILYGVYSANGGFLALLPPGTYSSNGINSACTFTIGADCAVVTQ